MGSVCATLEAAELQKQVRATKKNNQLLENELKDKQEKLQAMEAQLKQTREEKTQLLWRSKFGVDGTISSRFLRSFEVTVVESHTLADLLRLLPNDFIYALVLHEHDTGKFMNMTVCPNMFKEVMDKFNSDDVWTLVVLFYRAGVPMYNTVPNVEIFDS